MDDATPPGGTGAPPRVAPPPPPLGDSAAGGRSDGPRVSAEQMRDVSRIRRVAHGRGRTVAGVCEGVARHLDIDPTLVKVVFVVLAFFGGAGILLYAALWLLVPDEATERAIIGTSPDARRVLVIAAAAVAALIVLAQGWGGWWFGPALPIGLAVLVVVLLLIGRDQRRQQEQAGQPHAEPYAPAPFAPRSDQPSAPVGPAVGGPVTAAPGPRGAWRPPAYTPPPPRAPRPRRTGMVWFWPTLALIAVGLGGLGLYDTGHAVAQSAYPALALAITGLMLVVGSVRGRPGGLTLLGVVAALVLGLSSTIGGFHEGQRTLTTPPTAADVRPAYTLQTGELVLDLTQVDDVAALDGRDVEISGGTGAIEVVVPRDVTVHVDAEIHAVGGYRVGTAQGGGFTPGTDTTLAGPSGSPELDLDVDLRVGQITVRHPYE